MSQYPPGPQGPYSQGPQPPYPPQGGPVLPYQAGGGLRCPRCGSPMVKPVKFTWWGGLLGPKMLKHTKCDSCSFTFNAKTGKSNTTAIIIYQVVAFGIAIGIFLLLFLSGALK